MRLKDRLDSAPPLERITDFIDWVRDFRGPESLKARQDAEEQARKLLDERAGSFTREQAVELGRIFNTDARDGEIRYDRFAPAFHGSTWDRVLENFDLFNERVRQLWRSREEEALAVAHEIFIEKRNLPGAGRSLPTVLLYLRKPQKFAIWFNALEIGLSALTGTPRINRRQGVEGYLKFASEVMDLASRYGLAAPEVDGVLALAARLSRRGPSRTRTTTLLGDEAFRFLADLVNNNNAQWMSANRERYKREVREPFRALLQTVADDYISAVDPELNTDIKTGGVLASIRRRFPNEEGEYYPYYWGAFTRRRKQEDAQLYVALKADQLEAGISFGSVAVGQLALVKERAKPRKESLWAQIAPIASNLRFVASRDPETEMVVSNANELATCLAGDRPKIFQAWTPGGPPVGTAELAAAVGETLKALYPVAALAWTENPASAVEEDTPEYGDDEYELRDLAQETLLATEDLEEWVAMLQGSKRQAIFYGPPGTGKTYVAEKLARHLAAPSGQVEVVQFHPSFSYEDFIEGLRPAEGVEGIQYEVRPGIFRDFCDRARGRKGTFVMIIDEINRADLGSVLGELLMLLEYRGKSIPLPYSKKPFSIPKNVVVVATMNTADRSLALLDFALRRRFHTISMLPSREVLSAFLREDEDAELALQMFDLIQDKVGNPEVAPGHTYFMTDDVSADGLRRIWRYELAPYLAEFWFEQRTRLQDLERAVAELLAEGA